MVKEAVVKVSFHEILKPNMSIDIEALVVPIARFSTRIKQTSLSSLYV